MSELIRNTGTDAAFTLCPNRHADPALPWTPEQDSILNDAALAEARATISGWAGYEPTPLHSLPSRARQAGVAEVLYKDEGSRFGLGSFKALGGAYAVARLLRTELTRRLGRPVSMTEVTSCSLRQAAEITVCCATDGNHGRSVAWGAQSFGARCVIFLHAAVSKGREEAIAAYGARIRRTPGNYDDSVRDARQTAEREGWFVVSDTSYPGYMAIPRDVMQGYEVMADEAFGAMSAPPTHIFLQTGVGGMAAAVTARAKRRWGAGRPRIVLCDPDRAACWRDSFRADAPVAVTGDLDTLMAGLACGEVSALAWKILRDHADAAMALTDAAAVREMIRLARPEAGDPPLVAGESAVAGLAGLMAVSEDREARQLLKLDDSSRVLVFGTESDTDPEVYAALTGLDGEELRRATG
ncbi:diaminopropionate ammonia-lyase [Salipiger sp.]|uniref:diaminopropionate ammonia-lyase n=1 Tax=Salipiger sp. TaxID=2078585 RepID=UPI003A96CCFE